MFSSTYLKRQSIVMNPKANETQKKIASVLFNDQADNISSKDLNAIAALTFNPKPAEDIYGILTGALDMQQNSWQTLLKSLIVANHLVRYGAERCVDHSWDILRRIETLVNYNSAMIRGTFGTMGGRDNGLPVRERAGPFVKLLNSPDEIRQARLANQDAQGAICPDLGTDDYKQTAGGGGLIAFGTETVAAREQGIKVERDQSAFGSQAGTTLAAKFDLSHVPGMYEGRPDRFFDNPNDLRNHRSKAEDSHITRNALAPDLLDLDFGSQAVGGQGGNDLPEVVNLAASLNEQKLQAQLKAQQEQLEMMRLAMAGGGNGNGQMQQGNMQQGMNGSGQMQQGNMQQGMNGNGQMQQGNMQQGMNGNGQMQQGNMQQGMNSSGNMDLLGMMSMPAQSSSPPPPPTSSQNNLLGDLLGGNQSTSMQSGMNSMQGMNSQGSQQHGMGGMSGMNSRGSQQPGMGGMSGMNSQGSQQPGMGGMSGMNSRGSQQPGMGGMNGIQGMYIQNSQQSGMGDMNGMQGMNSQNSQQPGMGGVSNHTQQNVGGGGGGSGGDQAAALRQLEMLKAQLAQQEALLRQQAQGGGR